MRIFKDLAAQDSEFCFDEKQKIWSGKRISPLFHKDVSVGQVGLFVLGLNPQKVVQICDATGERLTGQDIAQLGVRVAQNLRLKAALQQEDVIGIMASNSTYLAPVVLGAFLIGTPISPIHYAFDRKTVKDVYSLTKPKVVFCDVDSYDTLIEGLKELGLRCKVYTLKGRISGVACVDDLFEKPDSDEVFVPPNLIKGGEQTAAILCTSGTTGVPKGVRISHQKLLRRCELSFLTPDDVVFSFSTIHWITGVWFLLRTLITGTQRIITDHPFSPELFLELIEKYKINFALSPPAHAALTVHCPDLAWRDLSSLHTFICGGAALSLSVAKKLTRYLRPHCLSEAYGLSELGAITNINRTPLEKKGSAGRLTPNTRAKIVADNGRRLGVNELGEVRLWCTSKWAGYYDNPEETQLTMDKDGWIRTGDVGFFDEDGFLYICGRQKELLRHNHFLISPFVIEEVIIQIPGVLEVCVFATPDMIEEDMPTAAIVKCPGSALTEEEVRQTVAKSLPDVKHLRGGVFFVKELPKTSTGKVQRHKMLAIVEDLVKLK